MSTIARSRSPTYTPILERSVAPSTKMPHEDEEMLSSRPSLSSMLLEEELLLEDVNYKKRGLLERAVTYLHSPHRGRRKQRQSEATDYSGCEGRMFRRKKILRRCMKLGVGILLLLGIFQLFLLLLHLPFLRLPDRIHRILQHWGEPGQPGAGLAHYPTDFTRDIRPVHCHSHNDYWRMVPLYDAIEVGCIGVEADIWLFDSDDNLYVGHDKASLTRNRTLKSLYIDPLIKILDGQNPTTPFVNGNESRNGVFDTVPEQTLILLIDFKTSGETLWPHVVSALEPLRERNLLSYSNGSDVISGPITVVGTGDTPFHLVSSTSTNPHQDIFFDAPLNEMNEPGPSKTQSSNTTYTTLNSYYASVAFPAAIGDVTSGHLSPSQLSTLRAQVRGAHARGLKARYWDLPFWPIGLRNAIWKVLVEEGVDLLNVDDLRSATRRDWGSWRVWWKPNVI